LLKQGWKLDKEGNKYRSEDISNDWKI
jgi:hypothetical protein